MPNVHPVQLFIPEIKSFIQEKKFGELKRLLSEINPIDLADGFSHFSSDQQLLILKLLPSARIVEVFEELEIPQQEYLIQHLEDETISPLLEGIPADVTAKLFKKLPEKMVRKMSTFLKKERFETIQTVMEFPPNTAGAIMHTECIPISPEMSARSAIERVQVCARVSKSDITHALYVSNGDGRLLGGLGLATLISAPADIKVKDIMSPVALIKIPASLDQEEVAKIFSRYKLISAPVVDSENRFMGILTVDDIISVIQDEATEDIAKLAGTQAEELETGSFLRVTALRMPWLLASYVGGILASFIVSQFEGLLSRIVLLASFMPVIAGMGGNVGTQSSTIVVRGLATGRIAISEVLKVVRREFAVGLLLGLTYGCLLAFIAYLQHGPGQSVYLPLVVGVAILTSMTVAATMGTLTPIVFKKIGIDPAAVSAPFVSTSTDIISILVYFLLATWLLL